MAALSREQILTQNVFSRGVNLPFGALTARDAADRAQELRDAAGAGGPMARVASVARAWRELAMALERAGCDSVAELEDAVVLELAPRLWVVPPGGSLLS
jgi:hypothetical protein